MNRDWTMAYAFLLGMGTGHALDWAAGELWASPMTLALATAAVWCVASLGLYAHGSVALSRGRRLLQKSESEVKNLNHLMQMRLEAMTAFNHCVCHDLHAPLRSIEGFAEALVEDYADRIDPTMGDYLRRVKDAAGRMRMLLDDMMRLLEVSSPKVAFRPERFSMTDLVRAVIEVERTYPCNQKHAFLVQPGMSAVGDVGLVRLLVQNLVANAFKFSGREDRPSVEVGREGGEFFVRDNGVGFDEAQSHRLFQPFSRLATAEQFQGTGIGLTICKRVIDLHGGTIRASGNPGCGATFYFTLCKEAGPNGAD